jgi:hypothetical protein
VINAISWPLNESDRIPRKEIMSMKKITTERRMEESKHVLDWIINTHTLTMALLQDKNLKWAASINLMTSSGWSNFKVFEKSLRRLNQIII